MSPRKAGPIDKRRQQVEAEAAAKRAATAESLRTPDMQALAGELAQDSLKSVDSILRPTRSRLVAALAPLQRWRHSSRATRHHRFLAYSPCAQSTPLGAVNSPFA